MVAEGAIFGIGNPLLDISATVPTEFLAKYDVKLNNAILAEDKHLPLYDELVKDFEVVYTAGGATQNSMRVAQWMLQAKRGTAAFVGAVGTDQLAQVLEAAAHKDLVHVNYLRLDTVPTGKCAVLINNNERSLIAQIGAAGQYQADHVRTSEVEEMLNRAHILYSAGFFLASSKEAALYVADYAVKNNKIFAVNLAAAFVCQFFHEPLVEAITHSAFVFGNESEAVAFAEAAKWEERDIPSIARKIADLPQHPHLSRPRTVVITQGSESTIVTTHQNPNPTTFPVVAIPKELLVDSNGAGDAFVGGFLSQLVMGKEIGVCVEAGHYAAGVVVRRSGCTFPEVPHFDAGK